MTMEPDRTTAQELIHGLVAIPSLSGNEQLAASWLVQQMTALGFSRAFADEAGNAVGEIGPSAAPTSILLLGHIDTVPGDIPVHLAETAGGMALFGRGSVDAKGPLAAFVIAAARLGEGWARDRNVRLIVVGAVEEEAATSAGARYLLGRFDGQKEPIPAACVIGEPSSWERMTLGYKGRLLVELLARQAMAHTAGPDPGIATAAVALWNWLSDHASAYNAGRNKVFDQLSPSLRRLQTGTDDGMVDFVEAQVGIRLPLDLDIDRLVHDLCIWAATNAGIEPVAVTMPGPPTAVEPFSFCADGAGRSVTLSFRSYEPAWRADRYSPLVRSFMGAIRYVSPETRPGLVVKTGTSDMNVVAPVWGCPILAYGPGDSQLDHTPDEHLLLEEYWQAIQVLERALSQLPLLLR